MSEPYFTGRLCLFAPSYILAPLNRRPKKLLLDAAEVVYICDRPGADVYIVWYNGSMGLRKSL